MNIAHFYSFNNSFNCVVRNIHSKHLFIQQKKQIIHSKNLFIQNNHKLFIQRKYSFNWKIDFPPGRACGSQAMERGTRCRTTSRSDLPSPLLLRGLEFCKVCMQTSQGGRRLPTPFLWWPTMDNSSSTVLTPCRIKVSLKIISSQNLTFDFLQQLQRTRSVSQVRLTWTLWLLVSGTSQSLAGKKGARNGQASSS